MARKEAQTLEQWVTLARQAGYNQSVVAQLLKVGPRQLRRYTRKVLKASPQRWLDEQRLTRAAIMLKGNDLVKMVAFDLGFKTVSHFSNKFKARYGVSPKVYKERAQV